MGNSKNFIQQDWFAGLLLLIAGITAIYFANSNQHNVIESFIKTFHAIDLPIVGPVKISWLYLVNNGLMTCFFFLMGLEIKRELVAGSLKNFKSAALPFIAAIGGIIFPAIIFVTFNYDNSDNLTGWAIPCATDIAFAVAALSVLGSQVPASLKVILLAIAIIDDIAAILIIALFYSSDLNISWLGLGLLVLPILYICNQRSISNFIPYFLCGIILWYCLWRADLHATLAGVMTAFFVPMFKKTQETTISPLKNFQHAFHLPVALLIMPLFGFMNAGVRLIDAPLDTAFSSLSVGVFLGLVVGKPLGIMFAVWCSEKMGWVKRLPEITWGKLFIVAQLCGIGFTMSLYIGQLAYTEAENLFDQAKLSILIGSLTSIILSYAFFWLTKRR